MTQSCADERRAVQRLALRDTTVCACRSGEVFVIAFQKTSNNYKLQPLQFGGNSRDFSNNSRVASSVGSVGHFLSLRSGSSAFHHEMTLENRGKKVTQFLFQSPVASSFLQQKRPGLLLKQFNYNECGRSFKCACFAVVFFLQMCRKIWYYSSPRPPAKPRDISGQE